MSEQEQQYKITTMLKGLLQHSDDKVRGLIGDCVDDFMGQMKSEEERGVKPIQLSAGLQHAADLMLEESKATNPEWPNVFCRKGCSHCCKMTVAITGHEARQLVHVAKQKGIVLDTARLVRQLPYEDESWKLQPEEDRACPFLGADGLCQVYDDRPLSCRKYFVITPAEQCDIQKFPGSKTLVLLNPSVEMLTTAAFTHADCGFMPKMLLEALAEEVPNAVK